MRKPLFLMIAMAGLIICPTIVNAQYKSDDFKPQWMHRIPKPTNDTFIYTIVTSSSHSLEDARRQTINDLMEETGLKSGVAIISDYKSKEIASQVWENGHLQETITNDFENNIQSRSKEIKLHALKIDEYYFQDKNGLYHVSRLYAKSELGEMPLYDNVYLPDTYADDPTTWGLSLIPGAAQMHKGSYVKGGIIMGSSVALVGGIVAFENQRSSYMSKISQTHSADVKKTYNNNANNAALGRNICIGGLAALYVYNIVDAFVAPGARRIIVTPSATADGQYGLSASINF